MPLDKALRAKLVKGNARLERLRQRNDQQRAALGTAAGKMADHATGFVAGLHDRVEGGDATAAQHARRALVERATARQLAGRD